MVEPVGRVAGKRALVTGAGSGIGRAVALRLAAEGARVGAVDADEPALDDTVRAIGQLGGDALPLVADVTDEGAVAGAVARTLRRWGGLEVLVPNAGIQLFGEDARVHELDTAVWRRTVEVNLTGIFLTCKHGVRAMLDRGGSVVVTGSPTGLFGLAGGFSAYSASKAGAMGLARVMASDYAGDGIRVNVVVPGFTETPLVAARFQDREGLSQRLSRIPLGRAGTAEEVAAMVLWLASDEAAYAVGGLFTVDGGLTAI